MSSTIRERPVDESAYHHLVHGWSEQNEKILREVVAYTTERLRMDPPSLDHPASESELKRRAGQTITTSGIGSTAAMKVFAEVLAPANISTDHPRNLAFIPSAPTEASVMFDLIVGASSIYAGSWLEGAGVVHAENEVIAWFAGLVGYPATARGVFVPGGTQGNLAALVAARHRARKIRRERGLPMPNRWAIISSFEAHSSMKQAAEVMDVDLYSVAVSTQDANWVGEHPAVEGQLRGVDVDRKIRELPPGVEPFVIAASAGTTNYGIIDDLDSLADVAEAHGLWLHVDGAYGAAALVSEKYRDMFAGIDRSDSIIVDPHKWLFSPFDACMLIYKDPEIAKEAHTQKAGYLDVVTETEDFNPSDYAIQLSRRARGLPLWFSLATHGTDAYATAMNQTMSTTAYAADQINQREYLELIRDPMLSVVVFRRKGWQPGDYHAWSERVLMNGLAFVTPTDHYGETVTRLAIVNPRTLPSDIDLILDSLA